MKTQGDLTAMNRSLGSTATVRLAGIHRMDVFYTPLEERFERITRIGKRALDVRVAAVSLFSKEKQWFKSVIGWKIEELPIEDSLCRAILEGGEPLVVANTLRDSRFSTARLVKGGPKFRFYAGYPVKDAEGAIIGSFCVFDVKPRKVDDEFVGILKDLGQLAERELVTADLWDAQNQLVAKLGEARRQALLDTLTRVWNRRGGMELLDMMLERSHKSYEQFAVCMVDVDFFKDVNDNHGHPSGDQVLKKIAAGLVSSVRPDDIVARYGGDEFMLVLRDCSVEMAQIVCDRIRTNLQGAKIRTRKGSVKVTLSLGVTVNDPAAKDTAKQMIARADQALYHTKKTGRDGVSVWSPELAKRA
jgi:diguanylate cyclase (GGDEF)-like protein